MTPDKIIDLQNGLYTAFIDQTYRSNLAYRPQFVYNDNKKGQKVFQKYEEYHFIIGSSNLTQDALTRNMEWNTKVISTNKGEEYGMVERNAARYLRVHFLNDDLKLMLDTGRLTLVACVEISFLNEEEQNLVYRVLQTDGIKADLDNARELCNRTGNLTMVSIMDILTKGKSIRISYSSKRVVYIKEKYFKETEPEQMWETIEKALDKYFQKGAASV